VSGKTNSPPSAFLLRLRRESKCTVLLLLARIAVQFAATRRGCIFGDCLHHAIRIDRYNLNSFDPSLKRVMKNVQQGTPASSTWSPGGRSASSAVTPQSSPARAAASAAGEVWRAGNSRHEALHSTGEDESPVASGCWPLQIQSLSLSLPLSLSFSLSLSLSLSLICLIAIHPYTHFYMYT